MLLARAAATVSLSVYPSDGANDVADQAIANVSITIYLPCFHPGAVAVVVGNGLPISSGGFSDPFDAAKNSHPDSHPLDLFPHFHSYHFLRIYATS